MMRRTRLAWASLALLVAAGVVAAVVAALRPTRPAAEPGVSDAGAGGNASAVAEWQRLRTAFLASPPKRIATDVLEHDGTRSYSTDVDLSLDGDAAVLTKRNRGPDATTMTATFSAKEVRYAMDPAPKDVVLASPLGRAIRETWFDYGTGALLAVTFTRTQDVESRLRDPTGLAGAFVPLRANRDDTGRLVLVEGVLVRRDRRVAVTVSFDPSGRPVKRTLRDPTPPKTPSTIETYSYP
jgi:hypothetical protein